MATVDRPSRLLDKLSWHLAHHKHADWDHFSAAQQEQMLRDDMEAGRNVSLILTALVTIGMMLSAGTLLYVLLAP